MRVVHIRTACWRCKIMRFNVNYYYSVEHVSTLIYMLKLYVIIMTIILIRPWTESWKERERKKNEEKVVTPTPRHSKWIILGYYNLKCVVVVGYCNRKASLTEHRRISFSNILAHSRVTFFFFFLINNIVLLLQ